MIRRLAILVGTVPGLLPAVFPPCDKPLSYRDRLVDCMFVSHAIAMRLGGGAAMPMRMMTRRGCLAGRHYQSRSSALCSDGAGVRTAEEAIAHNWPPAIVGVGGVGVTPPFVFSGQGCILRSEG